MPDREKVIDGLNEVLSDLYMSVQPKHVTAITDALALLKEQETVVRCKDCEYYDGNYCTLQLWYSWAVPPNWFCADGERR